MDKTLLPEVVVFCGPNGSGKSTITRKLKPNGIDYINADDIKRENHCIDLEAAETAEKEREDHLAQGEPFCFETVMSTDRNLKLLQRAKAHHFFIRVYVVLTADSVINVMRVQERVAAGGHNVPIDKILGRYGKALALVKKVVQVADVCNIYDNSGEYPVRFFNKKKERCYYEESPYWSLKEIRQLTGLERLTYRDLNIRNPFVRRELQ